MIPVLECKMYQSSSKHEAQIPVCMCLCVSVREPDSTTERTPAERLDGFIRSPPT